MGNPCETQDGRRAGGKRERAVPKPHGLMSDWVALARSYAAGGSRRGNGSAAAGVWLGVRGAATARAPRLEQHGNGSATVAGASRRYARTLPTRAASSRSRLMGFTT